MKLKIEKETKYGNGEIITRYYVWVDFTCIEGFDSEYKAKELVNKIKNSSNKLGSETIFEEEI